MTSVIAHRGASLEAPENSMQALYLGLELGADAIELDVRQSRDGTLFVIHDPTLDRTTDAGGRLLDLDASDIRRARQPNGERIPELDEVFEAFPAIELTVDVKDVEAVPKVVERIHAHDRVAATILYAEDGTTECAFREYEGRRATSTKQALRLALEFPTPPRSEIRQVPEVVHTPLSLDGTRIVGPEFVRRMQRSGRTVQVWTVDDASVARELIAWGVDGIITNDVRGLRALVTDGREAGGAS